MAWVDLLRKVCEESGIELIENQMCPEGYYFGVDREGSKLPSRISLNPPKGTLLERATAVLSKW